MKEASYSTAENFFIQNDQNFNLVLYGCASRMYRNSLFLETRSSHNANAFIENLIQNDKSLLNYKTIT